MSTFPNSPRLQKGALVGVDVMNPVASVIVFQYNPETLTRTLTPQTGGGEGSGGTAVGEGMRLAGPPQETMRLEAILDATDQLATGEPPATLVGLHPQIAALEMLLYPKSASVIVNEALLRAGVLEVVPPEAPFTVFVWGASRVLPVRLTEFSVAEEFFDPNLNPIRARVTLGLLVLSYHDLGLASTGGAMFMAQQIAKEAFATMSTGLHAASRIQELTR